MGFSRKWWWCSNPGGMPRLLIWLYLFGVSDYGSGNWAFGFRKRAFDFGRFAFHWRQHGVQ